MAISKNTKLIPLTQGKFAIVDADDFDWLNQWKWHCSTKGYAERKRFIGIIGGKHTNKNICMHRLIINTPKDKLTDHINGNKLDNRKCNLRVCTNSQNVMNQHKIKGVSKYKGVCFRTDSNKWRAYINKDGIRKYLGSFCTEIEAADAYNEAAKEIHGEFARCNLI